MSHMPMKTQQLRIAGVDESTIRKLLERGNIGVAYWMNGEFRCFCMSDKGRKGRYICANTPSIGFFEGFRCDTCKTYFKGGF
jgi:hypothetical protein